MRMRPSPTAIKGRWIWIGASESLHANGLVLGGGQYHAFVADGVMIVKEKISGKSGT